MTLTNITIDTITKYGTGRLGTVRHGDSTEMLSLTVPIPGGKAVYEIALPKGMKSSLEAAMKLSPVQDKVADDDSPF